jgi:hypothetical protein
MRVAHIPRISFGILAAMWLLGVSMPVALGQGESAQSVSNAVSLARALAEPRLFDDGLVEVFVSEAMVLVLCGVWCGLLVAGMAGFDIWREKREKEAASLHTRIATALQRDGLLGHLAVTPIVHLPLWGWSQATIELRGHVPRLWLRYAVLRVTEREAAASAAACHILDRITIGSSVEALAS